MKIFTNNIASTSVLPNQKIIFRPQNLNWIRPLSSSDKLVEGEVQKILFMGSHYEIKIKISKTVHILYRPIITIHSAQRPTAVGVKVELSWLQKSWALVNER